MSYYLLVILSALFATSSGNLFNPFAPLAALRSFSPFSSFPSFGSSFSNYPFGQSYGSSYSSDDPFNSIASSPFQNTFQPSPTPQATSPFGSGFQFPSFPSFPPMPPMPPMPSFPSFSSLTNGLKGSGYKIISTSSDGKNGGSGQITIQVEKIDDKKPGEQKRVIQSFRTSGPLVPSNQMKGKGQNGNDRQRFTNRPTKNQRGPQSNGIGNQQRRPSYGKPMRPVTPTKAPTPLNDLSVNGTSSQQQSATVVSSNKPIRQDKNNNQLIKNNGATVSSSKTSSSLSIPSTSQNIVNENRSSFNSENSKVTSSANSQSSRGVTVKRVNSSGQVTTGLIQP